jgi:hypothetical protein
MPHQSEAMQAMALDGICRLLPPGSRHSY